MSKKCKIVSLLLVLTIILTFSLTGCKKDELQTVRLIEVTHSLFYTPQYIAITQGFFEEEGINQRKRC